MSVFSWISLAVGIIGAIIGITGWLSGRDKKTSLSAVTMVYGTLSA